MSRLWDMAVSLLRLPFALLDREVDTRTSLHKVKTGCAIT